jgi:hypothetical protein
MEEQVSDVSIIVNKSKRPKHALSEVRSKSKSKLHQKTLKSIAIKSRTNIVSTNKKYHQKRINFGNDVIQQIPRSGSTAFIAYEL